jgi:protein TonB
MKVRSAIPPLAPSEAFPSNDPMPSGALPRKRTMSGTPDAPKVMGPDAVYFEFQVEQPVRPAADSRGPRYPEAEKAARREGEVLAQFVVDTTGQADLASFKVLGSTGEAFATAVREALPSLRFLPAEVGGRKVKQLVQQPFQFALSKQP